MRGNQGNNHHLLTSLLGLASGLALVTAGVLLYFAFAGQVHGCSWKKGEVRELPDGDRQIFISEVDSNGIHTPTGLVYAPGIIEVQRNCTVCHSPKLITQTAATREGWIQIIGWMQRTQGLWDLGKDQNTILDYLTEQYAPEEHGRRANLDVSTLDWYHIE